MGIISLLTFLFITSHQKTDNSYDFLVWADILVVLSFLLLLEMLIKLFILGFAEFIKHYFYLYELITSSLLFVVLLYHLIRKEEITNIKLIDAFVLFRIIRVFYLLLEINSFKEIFESLFSFIPFMLDHLAALLTFYCFFTVLGMHLFGGLLNKHVELTFPNGNSYASYYYYSNFNDFMGGLLMLFSLMIINNWNNQVFYYHYF